MTSWGDEQAMTMIRDMSGDLTALDAAVEVLKTETSNQRLLGIVGRLVKRCLKVSSPSSRI